MGINTKASNDNLSTDVIGNDVYPVNRKTINYMSTVDRNLLLKHLKIISETPDYLLSYLSDEHKKIVSKAAALIKEFGGIQSLVKELESFK